MPTHPERTTTAGPILAVLAWLWLLVALPFGTGSEFVLQAEVDRANHRFRADFHFDCDLVARGQRAETACAGRSD